MSIFLYRARDRSGKLHLGQMNTDDPRRVVEFLRSQDYLPITIKRKSDSLITLRKFLRFEVVRARVRPADLIYFLREVGSMLRAGITLLSSLSMIIEESKHPTLTAALKQIKSDVEAGSSLSEAMGKHAHIFDHVAVNVVKAGEIGGNIGEALEQLAELVEYEDKNAEKVKAVTRYPKIVMSVILMALIVLFTFVLPRFTALFQQVGATLPLPTRILLGIHAVILHSWYYFVGGGILAYFFFKKYIKGPKGAYWWGKCILGFPVLGELSLRLSIARFARFFGALYRFGIPVILGLEIVHPIVRNPVVSKAIKDLQQPLSEGKRLNEAFSSQKIFPPFVVQLMAVGEATGDISGVLEKISHHYTEEVERSITKLTALLEPVLIVGVGAVVLFLALSVYLPLWSIYRAASPGG